MVAIAATAEPGSETTNGIMTGRTLVGRAAIRTVDRAMEVMAGAALSKYRSRTAVPRRAGCALSPAVGKGKHRYTGRMALCLDIDG
jgi:hypothetical protein